MKVSISQLPSPQKHISSPLHLSIPFPPLRQHLGERRFYPLQVDSTAVVLSPDHSSCSRQSCSFSCLIPTGAPCQPKSKHMEGKHAPWPLPLLSLVSVAPLQPSWSWQELISPPRQHLALAGRSGWGNRKGGKGEMLTFFGT